MYIDDWWEDAEDHALTKIKNLIENDQISPEEAAFMVGYVGM